MTADAQELEALRRRVLELERREADLRATTSRCNRIMDAVPDLLCVQDRDGRFLYANRAFCEFYGRKSAEILGAADDAICLAETAKAHADRRGHVVSTGATVDIPSERLTRSDGIALHYNVLWCPMRDAGGEIDAVVIRARGLRDDERSETARAESHAKAYLKAIPDMYFRVDRSGTYIDFSAGRGLDTALPPSLFMGKRVQDVTPDVAPWAMPALTAALETGEMQTHEFKLFVHGTFVDYEARVLPSGEDDVLFLVREIGKQKKTEEKLREADARFRAFEEQSMFGIFIVQEKELRYTNPKLAAIVGASPEDLLAHGLPITLLDDPTRPVLEALLGELEAPGKDGPSAGAQRTFRALRRDGTQLSIDVFAAKVSYGGKPAVIGVVLDVTDVRRAEEERARLQDEMLRIQEAMVAELSTPLIPISDDILVMPLIGSVDDRRAQSVMERLLHGVAGSRAKAVILDVTGMSSVTTQTASALVRCAQAVRLLGAKALITGIRPDVAQTLTSMGIDLAGIVALGTLKAGIAFAMGRLR